MQRHRVGIGNPGANAMWTCETCTESVGEDFDVCWSCGTSRDGTPDPTFVREDDAGAGTSESVDLEAEILARFKCSKCANQEAEIKRIAATGTGLTKLMDVQRNHFLVVSCARCGYSELYDERILGTRTGVADILDFLFGN